MKTLVRIEGSYRLSNSDDLRRLIKCESNVKVGEIYLTGDETNGIVETNSQEDAERILKRLDGYLLYGFPIKVQILTKDSKHSGNDNPVQDRYSPDSRNEEIPDPISSSPDITEVSQIYADFDIASVGRPQSVSSDSPRGGCSENDPDEFDIIPLEATTSNRDFASYNRFEEASSQRENDLGIQKSHDRLNTARDRPTTQARPQRIPENDRSNLQRRSRDRILDRSRVTGIKRQSSPHSNRSRTILRNDDSRRNCDVEKRRDERSLNSRSRLSPVRRINRAQNRVSPGRESSRRVTDFRRDLIKRQNLGKTSDPLRRTERDPARPHNSERYSARASVSRKSRETPSDPKRRSVSPRIRVRQREESKRVSDKSLERPSKRPDSLKKTSRNSGKQSDSDKIQKSKHDSDKKRETICSRKDENLQTILEKTKKNETVTKLATPTLGFSIAQTELPPDSLRSLLNRLGQLQQIGGHEFAEEHSRLLQVMMQCQNTVNSLGQQHPMSQSLIAMLSSTLTTIENSFRENLSTGLHQNVQLQMQLHINQCEVNLQHGISQQHPLSLQHSIQYPMQPNMQFISMPHESNLQLQGIPQGAQFPAPQLLNMPHGLPDHIQHQPQYLMPSNFNPCDQNSGNFLQVSPQNALMNVHNVVHNVQTNIQNLPFPLQPNIPAPQLLNMPHGLPEQIQHQSQYLMGTNFAPLDQNSVTQLSQQQNAPMNVHNVVHNVHTNIQFKMPPIINPHETNLQHQGVPQGAQFQPPQLLNMPHGLPEQIQHQPQYMMPENFDPSDQNPSTSGKLLQHNLQNKSYKHARNKQNLLQISSQKASKNVPNAHNVNTNVKPHETDLQHQGQPQGAQLPPQLLNMPHELPDQIQHQSQDQNSESGKLNKWEQVLDVSAKYYQYHYRKRRYMLPKAAFVHRREATAKIAAGMTISRLVENHGKKETLSFWLKAAIRARIETLIFGSKKPSTPDEICTYYRLFHPKSQDVVFCKRVINTLKRFERNEKFQPTPDEAAVFTKSRKYNRVDWLKDQLQNFVISKMKENPAIDEAIKFHNEFEFCLNVGVRDRIDNLSKDPGWRSVAMRHLSSTSIQQGYLTRYPPDTDMSFFNERIDLVMKSRAKINETSAEAQTNADDTQVIDDTLKAIMENSEPTIQPSGPAYLMDNKSTEKTSAPDYGSIGTMEWAVMCKKRRCWQSALGHRFNSHDISPPCGAYKITVSEWLKRGLAAEKIAGIYKTNAHVVQSFKLIDQFLPCVTYCVRERLEDILKKDDTFEVARIVSTYFNRFNLNESDEFVKYCFNYFQSSNPPTIDDNFRVAPIEFEDVMSASKPKSDTTSTVRAAATPQVGQNVPNTSASWTHTSGIVNLANERTVASAKQIISRPPLSYQLNTKKQDAIDKEVDDVMLHD